MSRRTRTIENKIDELEQQDSDDELTLCLLTRHGNAHDESKSVENADIVIPSPVDELLEIWDIDVSDDEDFDPWGRNPITGEVIE